MVYCSNCGSELRGANKFCSSCGYRLSAEEVDQLKGKSSGSGSSRGVKFEEVDSVEYDESDDDIDRDEYSNLREAEVVAKPTYTDARIPPGTVVKERLPKSNNCNICGAGTDEICFFCDYGICKKHSVKMKIRTDTGQFGNEIGSCPECAARKEGKQPTQEEAAEVGFFFRVKPYHEWKIIR